MVDTIWDLLNRLANSGFVLMSIFWLFINSCFRLSTSSWINSWSSFMTIVFDNFHSNFLLGIFLYSQSGKYILILVLMHQNWLYPEHAFLHIGNLNNNNITTFSEAYSQHIFTDEFLSWFLLWRQMYLLPASMSYRVQFSFWTSQIDQ